MNGRQKVVVMVGVAVVALMLLVPPWLRFSQRSGQISAGYGPIFQPPSEAGKIDLPRLTVQCAFVAALTFGVYVLLGHRKEP